MQEVEQVSIVNTGVLHTENGLAGFQSGSVF
jgi:hypothetical protein